MGKQGKGGSIVKKRATFYVEESDLEELKRHVPDGMVAKVAEWAFKRAVDAAGKYDKDFVYDVVNNKGSFEIVPSNPQPQKRKEAGA